MINKPKQQRPVPGGSTDLWGGVLNQNMDLMDNFASKVVDELGTHSQELSRLEQEKINMSDLNTIVADRVDNYIETDGKPQLDEHVSTINKPDLGNYTEIKKTEINNYVKNTSKPDINSHTIVKKTELDTHTESKEVQLDTYEKIKETELNNYTNTKQTQLNTFTTEKKVQITAHTDEEIARINATGIDGKLDKGNVQYYFTAKEIENVLEILYPTKKLTIIKVEKDETNESTLLTATDNKNNKYWYKIITVNKDDTASAVTLNYTEVKHENNSL